MQIIIYRRRIVNAISVLAMIASCLTSSTAYQSTQPPRTPHPPGKLLLAHYMPWYSTKQVSGFWGWHWTMGHFNPDTESEGRRQAASRFYPLIGLYDSSDPDVLDCQCQLMKLAGIDGVIIDWYGTDDYLDYAINHRNTLEMIKAVKRCGLKYAICFEDSTVPGLITAGKIKAADAVSHTHSMMTWVDSNWFQDKAYVHIAGRPLWLVFGNGYFQDTSWDKLFESLSSKPLLITEAHQRAGSSGAFDWPHPEGGAAGAQRETDLFYKQSASWLQYIPAAYPRFHDVYEQARVHKSYGEIPDNNGATFETTLGKALNSSAEVVQLATWNDWGEGTQIEPSIEYGYRDLETVQRLRRESLAPKEISFASDLKLPVKLLKLKKQAVAGAQVKLDQAEAALRNGLPRDAARILSQFRDEP